MSDMSIISAILVVVVAFLAGLEGILDQFQFHQPLVACTLIGAATGNLTAGIMLGGSLQMIALAWANIGAAVAPDAALASVAAAIILVKGGKFTAEGIGVATATAIPLAVAGLFLTMLVRTASVALVHAADKAAESAIFPPPFLLIPLPHTVPSRDPSPHGSAYALHTPVLQALSDGSILPFDYLHICSGAVVQFSRAFQRFWTQHLSSIPAD